MPVPLRRTACVYLSAETELAWQSLLWVTGTY